MLKLCSITLLMLTIYLGESNAVSDPKVVCYYEYWGYWRQGNGKMTVDDIDPSLCTHIVYAYLGINNVSYKVDILDKYLMVDLHDLSNFSKKKGSAKAMIAIGGSAQSTRFGQLAQKDADRITFVDSVVELLKQYNFDGVMIDWQYPQQNDSDNYVKLLGQLHEKLAPTSLILGIGGPALKKDVDDGFNVSKIISYVDFVSVHTIDLHGPLDSQVDYSAPLNWQLESLDYWVEKGADKHKLLMSLSLFARTWTLSKSESNTRHSNASGPGTAGPYTKTAGFLNYNELCAAMKANPTQWTIRRDNDATAIFAIHGNEWVSYEDSKTCAAKAKNASAEGFGGIVAYALGNDDFHGDCGSKKYPLLQGIKSGLNTEVVNTTTVKPEVFKCTKEGKFMDPLLCYTYHVCTNAEIEGMFADQIAHCEKTQGFDNTAQKCLDKNLVSGCK